MAARIDHLALAAHDAAESAPFLADIPGLPDPSTSGPFLAVDAGHHLEVLTRRYGFGG